MKILQVTPGYYPSVGGLQEHVSNISERLTREHQVTVFTGDPSGKLAKEERINGVLVKRFRSFSPNNAYHLSLEMMRELKKSEFDIVHGHNYHALTLYFSRYAKRKRFVVTPHYHGHGHTPTRNFLFKLYKPFGKRIFADADTIISVSNYEKELLIKDFGIGESRIRLIPNGIDQAEFASDGAPERTNTILYVGRLEEYKGVQYIIQTLPLLGEDICLEIVGRGTYEVELARLVDKLGLSHRVKFNQLLPRSELLKMYFTAGVFVLLSQREAFSIVVAEALVAKTPCVVANTSALKEWVDNRNCFGVDYPIDIAQLAEVISKAKGKRVTDVKLWDWDDVVRELEHIYELGKGCFDMSQEKDKFGEQYFESTSNYPRAILRDRIGLQSRFWLRYIKKRKSGGRLLDIGCGKGFFLECAEKFYETYGIDISEYAIEQARNRLHNTKLHIRDADHLDFDYDYFDIITCFDLLEHLDNPEPAIKKCYLMLTEGGLFIFRVPNTDSCGLSWLKEKWHGYRDPTHVSLLSNEEWSQLLERNGFRVIDRFYDGLWDSPYFRGVPALIQHVFFKFLFTVLFPLLGILGGIKLPRKWGENVILVSIK